MAQFLVNRSFRCDQTHHCNDTVPFRRSVRVNDFFSDGQDNWSKMTNEIKVLETRTRQSQKESYTTIIGAGISPEYEVQLINFAPPPTANIWVVNLLLIPSRRQSNAYELQIVLFSNGTRRAWTVVFSGYHYRR